MKNIPPITEMEWQIMVRLWAKYPQTAAEIVATEMDGKTLGDATVRTLLRRLVAKKVVSFTVDERNANLYYYYPLICEQDCVLKERRHFLDLYYRNNIGSLIADFVSDTDISAEEIDRLKSLLDQKKNMTE